MFSYQKSFDHAVKTRSVNVLADQAFKMCKAFNRFYLLCPVSTAESESVKASRVNLLKGFAKTMDHCMKCLNIETLEVM